MHATATIPPHPNRAAPRACDYAAYKERHLVECFIGKLKNSRRVATRYDHTASSLLGFVLLGCVRLWIRFGHAGRGAISPAAPGLTLDWR